MSGRCVSAIEALECDEVRGLGDDLEKWLATSPACDDMTLADWSTGGQDGTRGADGTSGADGTGGTGGTSIDDVPCSNPAGAATTLALTNNADTAVDIFWVAEDCSQVIQITLAIGDTDTIGTFVGHTFLARELTGARALVDWVQVSTEGDESWSISR